MSKNNTIGRMQCYHWYTKNEDGIPIMKTPNFYATYVPIQLHTYQISTVKLENIEVEQMGSETTKHGA
jgi:hypothetical protein